MGTDLCYWAYVMIDAGCFNYVIVDTTYWFRPYGYKSTWFDGNFKVAEPDILRHGDESILLGLAMRYACMLS